MAAINLVSKLCARETVHGQINRYSLIHATRLCMRQNVGLGRMFSVRPIPSENPLKLTRKAKMAARKDIRAQLKSNASNKATYKEFKQLFGLIKKERSNIFISLILVSISTATTVVLPKAIGAVVDIDASGKIIGLSYNQFFVALGATVIIGILSGYARIFILKVTSERVVAKLRSRMFKSLLRLDGGFFDANKHGDLISRLGADAVLVSQSLTNNLADGIRGIVQGLFSFTAMALISLDLSKQVLLIVPVISVVSLVYGIYIRKLSKRTQEALGDLSKIAEERLGSVKTVQAFTGERFEVHNYNKSIRNLFKLRRKEAVIAGGYYSFNSLAGRAYVVAILGFGGRLVAEGHLTAGDLTSYFLYTIFAGGALANCASTLTDLMKGSGAASRIFELLNQKPLISSTSGHPLPPLSVSNNKGTINFENVNFAYPTRPLHEILKDFSMEIPPGSNIAICGASGGGKSTIANLLLRYYIPSKGKITLDGVEIKSYNLKRWRQTIAIVSQDPDLFSGSIKDNIAYGSSSATMFEIIEAADKANCNFIAELPERFDTQVGSRGEQLSGGQKQRIAIARALIRKPKLLILDEATSALDGTSEVAVELALQNLMQTRQLTTLTIAHRLGTIRKADIINVIGSNGSIVESGKFSEVAKPGSLFMELMKWQMQQV